MKATRRLLLAAAVAAVGMSSLVGSGAALASHASDIKASIRFATWDNKTMFPLLNDIFKNMHKTYPGITVKVEPWPDSRVKMVTQIATGTAPDVIQVGDGDLAWFASKNSFENLDPYLARDKMSRDIYFPQVFNIGVVNGHVYALTKDYATLAVFYNKDLFDKAHLKYPAPGWTVDEMIKDAQALTVTQNGRRVQWGINLSGDWTRGMDPIIRDFGGQLSSADGMKIQGYMNSPQTIKAVQFYVDLYNKYHIAPSPAEQKAFSNLDLFSGGKVAMNWTGPWEISTWLQVKGFHFGVAPLPTINGHDYSNICWAGFAMNPKTSNKEAAWQVVKALGGPDGSAVFSEWALPAVKSVAAMRKSNAAANPQYKYLSVFLDQVKNVPGVPDDMRSADGGASVGDPFTKALDHLFANGGSVKDALDNAARLGQKEIDDYMSNQ